jgi:hypothetical protein
MEDRNILTSEETKEAFKALCLETLPPIQKISEAVKKSGIGRSVYISIGQDGYMNMSFSGSGWELSKIEEGAPVNIRYNFTEELEVPEPAKLSKEAENLVEISLAYADMASEFPKVTEIDSMTWKQMFVKWSEEFEKSWDESKCFDYLGAIESFAKQKIADYAGLEAGL